MVIVLICWVVLALLFSLALARAAARPVPVPEPESVPQREGILVSKDRMTAPVLAVPVLEAAGPGAGTRTSAPAVDAGRGEKRKLLRAPASVWNSL